MNMELLKDGCFLMILGMGFVFIFIQLMVWMVQINARILNIYNKWFPEVIEEEYQQKKKSTDSNAEIALAIACAYSKKDINYRRN